MAWNGGWPDGLERRAPGRRRKRGDSHAAGNGGTRTPLERMVPGLRRNGWCPDGVCHAVRAPCLLSGPEPSSPAPPPGPWAWLIRPHGTRRDGLMLPLTHQVDGAEHPPHALRRRVAGRQSNCPSSMGFGRAGERRARRACRASRDRHASACRSLTRSVSRSCHNAGCTVTSRVWARVLAVHLRGSC
jgi:hypothetical protein